jgi:hypothetical protein
MAEQHPLLERNDLKKALKGNFINRFDDANVRQIYAEIQSKLDVLELTYGVKIKLGTFRFEDYYFNIALKGSVLNTPNGIALEEATWNNYCKAYGFSLSDFERDFVFPDKPKKFAGLHAIICGINIRSKRVPIQVKLDDGRVIRCSPGFVKRGMI